MTREHVLLAGMAALAALSTLAARPAHAQFAAPTVVMHGLANPHGMTFGPDGGLYVAEAGAGGSGPSIVDGGGSTVAYGLSGGISRLLGGVQTRVVAGLPSLAPTGGGGATGLQDLAFDHSGALYGIMGLGADPALRATLNAGGASGNAFGQLVKFDLTDGSRQNIADIAAYEGIANPDGTDVNSNPYGFVHLAGGTFTIADAGGNDLLQFNPATNKIRTLAVFPTRPNPLPFGPPVYQPVPDAIVIGPDKNFYVGELTGFPFPAGAANIYKVNPTSGTATVVASGFTNIADLAFSPDGTLNVLEISEHGLANANGPVPGALFSVNLVSGTKTLIADAGLVFPTGMTVGRDGALYVSNLGTSPDGGQVLRFAPAISVTSLSPDTADVGAGAFSLTVYGTDFGPSTVVRWNGQTLATTYVSPTQVTASVPASLLASSGTADVTVQTPGVATSGATPFHIRPVILSLSPSGVTAGHAALALTVNGAGFTSNSIVVFNGTSLATNNVSPSKLTATVPTSLLTAGRKSVTVTLPHVATSRAFAFTVAP